MTPDEFRDLARKHFGYLIREYGFAEKPRRDDTPDELGFVVEYISSKTKVIIEVFWTPDLYVYLTDIDPRKVRYGSYPLSDLLELRRIRFQMPEHPSDSFSNEVLAGQMHILAQMLRAHAYDILNGDHSIFPVLADRTAERLKEYDKKRESEEYSS